MNVKKIATISISLLTAAGIVFGLTGAVSRKDTRTAVRTVTLEKGTLAQSVSATGMIYSSQSTEVYSNLNYSIATIHVAVGDRVNEGDVLAELDMSALESDISQKQASVWASQATANQNLATAQKDLETYRRNVENGNDSTLQNAESSVSSAERDLQNAELDVQTAELDVQSASADLSSARRELSDARNGEGDYEEMDATDSQIAGLRDKVIQKETALEKAQTNLEKVQTSLEKTRENLEDTKKSMENTKVSSNDKLVDYQDKVTNAKLSTNYNDQYIAIEKLKGDLEKGVITAPVSGTITEVNVVQGGSVSGKLFVIQETDNLKIISNIKEYDIDSVEIGDKVIIRADATGDQEFEGNVAKIAPTSTLTTSGAPQSSTDSEYETEIAVASNNKGLRVGMNTRLSIITQEKKNVYVVPYEAVGQNEDGESYILIAAEQEDGRFVAEALTVTIGMETDLRVEISAEGLADGMKIVKNIEGITSGTVIAVEA